MNKDQQILAKKIWNIFRFGNDLDRLKQIGENAAVLAGKQSCPICGHPFDKTKAIEEAIAQLLELVMAEKEKTIEEVIEEYENMEWNYEPERTAFLEWLKQPHTSSPVKGVSEEKHSTGSPSEKCECCCHFGCSHEGVPTLPAPPRAGQAQGRQGGEKIMTKNIHPIETIRENAVIQLFGEKLAKEFEQGITEQNVYMLEAMFKVPRKFWLKLQKNYDQANHPLEPAQSGSGVEKE